MEGEKPCYLSRLGSHKAPPLSPILFVIYAMAVNNPGPQPQFGHATSYVNDEVMTQSANTQKAAARTLQHRLDDRIEGASILNVHFAPTKAELMHNMPHLSRILKEEDNTGITLYSEQMQLKECIMSLRVRIDHTLSFKKHAAAVNATTRQATELLWRITKRKGGNASVRNGSCWTK